MIKSAGNNLQRLLGSPHGLASWRHAQQYLQDGRHAPALANYRSLVKDFPGIAQLWAEMGIAAAGALEFPLADQAFQRAVELAPADANMLVYVGVQYYQLRNMKQANACFERAVTADPSSFRARQMLASCLEKSRRLDEAWEYMETYLARHPKDGRALYFKAFLMHRQGLNNEAEAALRSLLQDNPLPPLDVQGDASHLLGLVLDGFGQYAEALKWFDKSKALKRQTANTAAIEQAYEKLVQTRRRVMAELTPEVLRRWREEASAAPCPHSLALLGGPPRSGTTLIEQILAAHPGIMVFDEPMPFAKEVLGPLQHSASGMTLKSLNGLAAAGRAQSIGRYFKSLLHETEEKPDGRLLLDKNPSTTAWLHVWLRHFPLSKIIVALRDPRDVILSCYFRNIPKEDFAMVSFISLERTARHYADGMDVWLRLRELGGFDWIETRYENVVAHVESEGRRVMNFLGLPWHESQANFYDTARRHFVHSPTYHEVRQPIYHRAVGRWQNYAEALAPLQSRLDPYLRALGYG